MILLDDTLTRIRPVDEQARAAAEARQLTLTKPAGALGELESIGNQLAAIAGQCPPPVPEPALVCVFAGDHGVHAQGVSPWPQLVSGQMAATIADGGAGVSVLARAAGAAVRVHDVGLLAPVEGVTDLRVAAGTRDFTTGPAMDATQCRTAIEAGIDVATKAMGAGFRLLVPGEVGIANTTPAAALVAAFTGADPASVTGRGTGADDAMLAHKVEVVAQGLARHGLLPRSDGTLPAATDPLAALAAVGGFEHAAIVGLVLGAAANRLPVVLDGAIACSAALVAVALCPEVRGYLVAGHRGAEPGIGVALDALGLSPVLQLGLRLGEGSGAALALPVVAASARVLREMATFGDAGVSEEHA